MGNKITLTNREQIARFSGRIDQYATDREPQGREGLTEAEALLVFAEDPALLYVTTSFVAVAEGEVMGTGETPDHACEEVAFWLREADRPTHWVPAGASLEVAVYEVPDALGALVAGTSFSLVNRANLVERRTVKPEGPVELVHCECGQWSGESCPWRGERGETQRVAFMPVEHRESHRKARNKGRYPHNGAIDIRVHTDCWAHMQEQDAEWVELLGDAGGTR